MPATMATPSPLTGERCSSRGARASWLGCLSIACSLLLVSVSVSVVPTVLVAAQQTNTQWDIQIAQEGSGALVTSLSSSQVRGNAHEIVVPALALNESGVASPTAESIWYWLNGDAADEQTFTVEPLAYRAYDDVCFPGTRFTGSFGIRSDGNVMVYSGIIYRNSANRPVADLMILNKLSNQWMREFGNTTSTTVTTGSVKDVKNFGTRLVPSDSNHPGHRAQGGAVVDQSTDDFYIHGGRHAMDIGKKGQRLRSAHVCAAISACVTADCLTAALFLVP